MSQDERTIVDNQRQTTNNPNNIPTQQRQRSSALGTAAAAVGGAAASGLLVGFVSARNAEMDEQQTDESSAQSSMHTESVNASTYSDGTINFATGDYDSMSFGEAFAAARAEVGAGGAFVWRGGVYGTYYSNEWNNMSAEERAEYHSHFNWNRVHHTSEQASAHAHQQHDHQPTEHHEITENEPKKTIHEHSGDANDEVLAEVAQNDSHDPSIEVHEIIHDDGLNVNLASVSVDGEEALLIDYDNDKTFDALVHDDNHDGEITAEEIVDISDLGMTVNDLGGFSNGSVAPAVESEPAPTVEVHDVIHDDSLDVNLASVSVDGEEALLIDYNSDETFDALVHDDNQDGSITENEIVDISDLGVTVNDLGGFSDDSLASVQ